MLLYDGEAEKSLILQFYGSLHLGPVIKPFFVCATATLKQDKVF
jgi:hypothetical protein